MLGISIPKVPFGPTIPNIYKVPKSKLPKLPTHRIPFLFNFIINNEMKHELFFN